MVAKPATSHERTGRSFSEATAPCLRYTHDAMPNISSETERLVRDFVAQIVAAVEAQSADRALAAVGAAFGGALLARSKRNSASPVVQAAVRKVHLTPAGLAVRKLQGKYLGLLRGLTLEKRARVKRVAREKGVAEAIKFAGSLT